MDNYNVYVHVTPDGKRYYGTTKQNAKKRWKKNGKGYEDQPYFYDAIQEFGWNNIEHIIVTRGLTQEEAYWLEEELIKELDTTNGDKGYNIAKGVGRKGLKHSEETKKKMSENHWDSKGENHPMYGKHHTEETRKKISEAHKGKNHPRAKSVICISTKRIFYTTNEGAEYYNCSRSHITKCCKGKIKSCGKLNERKLVWRYLVWNHNKKYRINKEK